MVAGWQSCHSGRWQLPCAPPRLAGMWVPLCRRPCSGSLMLPRGVRPVALQASDVVRKRQRRHCGGCFCAAFRYSARPVRWRAQAGILLLHLSCMLVARGVWPCRRGRLALQYGPFGLAIWAVRACDTGRFARSYEQRHQPSVCQVFTKRCPAVALCIKKFTATVAVPFPAGWHLPQPCCRSKLAAHARAPDGGAE